VSKRKSHDLVIQEEIDENGYLESDDEADDERSQNSLPNMKMEDRS